MKHMSAVALVFVGLGALLGGGSAAEAATRCKGDNLIQVMQQQYPANYQLYRSEADRIANNGSNLWRIQGPEGTAPSWLFGTIHVADPRVTELPAPVVRAIDASRVVALELEEAADPARLVAAVGEHADLFTLPAGQRLSQALDDREEQIVAQALASRGLPFAGLDQLQPWLLATMLAIPACEAARQEAGEPAVDAIIGQRALARNKPVVGLETVREQLGAFASIDAALQREYLVETAALGQHGEDLFETMILLYLAARSAESVPLTGALLGKANYGEGDGGFNAIMIDRRNVSMVRRADPLLRDGGAFVAVGALHLTGERGMVSLLREAGYRVEPVQGAAANTP